MDRTVREAELWARWRPAVAPGHLNPIDADAATGEPDCTVCVPVALLGEPLENVVRTVKAISDAAVSSGQMYDIVIWANALHNEDDVGGVRADALVAYAHLRAALARLPAPQVRLASGFEILSRDAATMSSIRNHYMDALLRRAREQGFGLDHPVLWLDADTTYVSRNAISDLAHAVRRGDGLIVHGVTKFTLDWVAKRTRDLDNPTIAVGIVEIFRRRMARSNRYMFYAEESGLALSLAAWLEAGGLDDSRTSESGQLIRALWENDGRKKAADTGRLQARNLAGDMVPVLRYVESARVGTSARRHLAHARAKGVNKIVNSDVLDYDAPYTWNVPEVCSRARAITGNALRAELLCSRNAWQAKDSVTERLIQRTLD